MTPIASLVLPILVAAVAVFVLSLIVQMVAPWHRRDFGNVPDDDAVLGAIRQLGLRPGDYCVPSPRLPSGARNPEFVDKWAAGPSVTMTVIPPSANMGRYMAQWFAFTLLVAAIAGGVTGTIVGPGGDDHAIFHYGAILTFLSYSLGAWPLSIWYHRKWSTAFKSAFDAILYGLLTGLVFTWLWPAM
ncbi:MAG TPA: hypothetical protein VFK13_05355 [Gemmatimonadaceae bacterium]|nr:hypothetical protein [Gemmatimonadaceae bacterium]